MATTWAWMAMDMDRCTDIDMNIPSMHPTIGRSLFLPLFYLSSRSRPPRSSEDVGESDYEPPFGGAHEKKIWPKKNLGSGDVTFLPSVPFFTVIENVNV